jgi:hypothetical protein
MYILIIQEHRIGSVKLERKHVVYTHKDAIDLITSMPKHHTLILFKEYIERTRERRTKERR